MPMETLWWFAPFVVAHEERIGSQGWVFTEWEPGEDDEYGRIEFDDLVPGLDAEFGQVHEQTILRLAPPPERSSGVDVD